MTAVGLADRAATNDELSQMKQLLAQGLEEGALGFSTGLEYVPERGCPPEEVVQLCRVAADAQGFYATHTRNRPGEASETIREAIDTAAAAHIPLQISHISVVARLIEDSRFAVEQSIQQVDQANRNGMDVGFDMHTRLFGTTNLSAVLPPWALEGSTADVAARLRSPSTRKEMRQHTRGWSM